jgi:hypothetical protein
MVVPGKSCLESRNIGDRGATLRSMGDKVGDIICVYWFQGVRVKELLHSFNHLNTVLSFYNDIKQGDNAERTRESLYRRQGQR